MVDGSWFMVNSRWEFDERFAINDQQLLLLYPVHPVHRCLNRFLAFNRLSLCPGSCADGAPPSRIGGSRSVATTDGLGLDLET